MVRKKKTEDMSQDSKGQQAKNTTRTGTESKPKNKVDRLVDIICKVADAEGYFDPKDVHAAVRETDLEKSASVVMSNLRLQGFVKDGRLRVPVAEGPDMPKKLVNLAAKLRKKGTTIPFEEAIATIRGESAAEKIAPAPEPEIKSAPEPRPEPKSALKAKPKPEAKPEPKAEAKPAPKAQPKRQRKAETKTAPVAPEPAVKMPPAEVPALQKPETDFRALYEASREEVLKLEAELAAYKDVCRSLIDSLKR